jgi:hypothetical protein
MSKIAAFNNVGSAGVIQDLSPERLPANDENGFAWSSIENCRPKSGEIAKIPGYSSLFSTSIAPWEVVQVFDVDQPVYFYMSGTQIYLYRQLQHYNMTRVLAGWNTINVGSNKTGSDLPFAANKAKVIVDVGGGKTGASATGWISNATNHLGNLKIDGVDYPISITGSAAQTYTTLISQINTDIGAVATASLDGNGNLLFTCDVSTANATSMVLTDTGSGITRSWALLTGYVSIGSATTHNLSATVTIDGGAPQTLATQSLQNANYTDFIAGLNSQFTGGTLTLTGGNLRITTAGILRTASVSISDTNLFSSLTGYTSITNTATDDIPYSTPTTNSWNTSLLNNIPVFNNGFDDPQYWPSPRATTTMLQTLQNWPNGTKCLIMRAFKAYLIALNITDAGGTRYPSKVKWSGSALPGALPTTWDITDVTADAGEQSLSDSLGQIVDASTLGNDLIIYKQNSTYKMSYVGGSKIFSIQMLFSGIGALSMNCSVEIGNQHFVVTSEDIIIHNGAEYKSIIDGRNRKWFFKNLNRAYSYRTRCVVNYDSTEVWVCYPSSSSQYIDSALIYNYESNVWCKRQLPSIYNMFSAIFDAGAPPTINGSSAFNAPAPTSALTVNVLAYGAIGNGITDDTAAIQSAINAVQGSGGTVIIGNGTYLVNPEQGSSLAITGAMTLKMSDGAILKAKTSSATHYDILRIESASNVNIIGGILQGERYTHIGSTGEWGFGLGIYASSNVYVENTIAKDCWGDGFYITDNHGIGGSNPSTNITLDNVTADYCRRNGISLICSNGVLIKDSFLKNTGGTNPQYGIDIEPNTGESNNNVVVDNCTFINNAAGSLSVFGQNNTNLVVNNNKMYGGTGGYILLISDADNGMYSNNIITSIWRGVEFRGATTGNTLLNNNICATSLTISNLGTNISTGNTLSNGSCTVGDPADAIAIMHAGGSEIINTANRIIDYDASSNTSRRLFAGIPENLGIFIFDSETSDTDNGSAMIALVERIDLPLEPEQLIKTVKRVWVRAGSRIKSPSPLQVYVGHAMRKNEPITWDGPFLFNILSDNYINCFSTGRYISIRFKSTTNTDWNLQGFDLEYDTKGRF